MPVYFLHVEGRIHIEDEFGLDLPNDSNTNDEASNNSASTTYCSASTGGP